MHAFQRLACAVALSVPVVAGLACANATEPASEFVATVYGTVSQGGQRVAAAFVTASVLERECLGALVETFETARSDGDGRYAIRLRVRTSGARCLLVNARRPEAPGVQTTARVPEVIFRPDDGGATDSIRVDLELPSALR